MKGPGDILNDAADQTVFLAQLKHDGWDLSLTQRLKGFDTPFSAHQIVALYAIGQFAATDGDRPLEADRLDAIDDVTMKPSAAATWV